MNITSISPITTTHPQSRLNKPADRDVPVADTNVERLDAREEIEIEESDTQNKPGALRLLEEGHFKGVAELRHRIRFHEELQARADEEAAQALREGAEDLTSAVNEGYDAIVAALAPSEPVETPDLVEDGLTKPFVEEAASTSDVQGVFDQFASEVDAITSGDDVNLATATTDLQAAFDGLVASLYELDSSDETIVTLDARTEEEATPSLLDDAIASLTSLYETALADLLASTEEASALPDPTPAPGNGAAFAKFLAIYDSLRFRDPILDATV